MAGHSAWKNIKHRKAAVDARRGKVWSKCARAIIVAAKTGGGDPDTNLALRCAIDEARAQNMPRATIDNAVKKGSGELLGDNYESAVYEGYGPGGVAILIDVLTNNRNRTAGDIRPIFDKHGGNLAAAGAVSYLFSPRGVLMIPKSQADEDRVMALALDAGAQDVKDDGENWTILAEVPAFRAVADAVAKAGLTPSSSEITKLPSTTIQVGGEQAKKVLNLIEALDDNDDVQKVYANFEIPAQELAALGG
jgi:YebC/PmpR family DNA-binding regulatory protein